ncbi:MAG: FAD-dependent oxidoreductase [Slackia sp.]
MTILVRGEDFTCAPVGRPLREHEKITVLTNTGRLRSKATTLCALRYRNRVTGEEGCYRAPEGDTFGLFVFAGYEPSTELVQDLVELSERGYVVTDEGQRTQVEGLYVAGDVCVKDLRQVVTATGDGAKAAASMEHYAAAMQEKTGLVPQRPASGQADKPGVSAQGTAGQGVAAKSSSADAQERFSTRQSARPARCRVRPHGDARNAGTARQPDRRLFRIVRLRPCACLPGHSRERRAGRTPRKTRRRLLGCCAKTGRTVALPSTACRGPLFTSFVLGLYNVAGPGQPLDDAVRGASPRWMARSTSKAIVSLHARCAPRRS